MNETKTDALPFWLGNTVHRESVLFVKKADGAAEASLIFTPSEIVKVESASGITTYRDGKDYQLSGGKLVLPEGSGIPFKTSAELYPRPATPGMPAYIRLRRHPDTGLLFEEGAFFHNFQTCVTYRHQDAWNGPTPVCAAENLSKTLATLKTKKKIRVGVSGDSISAGGNASKFTGVPPFQPAFPELVTDGIGNRFDTEAALINRAVGGWTSVQGLKDAATLAEEKPDLVIVAYGMNDDLQFTPAVFKSNIKGIMDAIRASNSEAEFILVAGMCGNSDWAPIQPEKFPAFRDALNELKGHGVAVADVTSIWIALMKRKSFLDLTGNGVNHPNDFTHRIYAQTILSLLPQP